ncbi:MAG: hypothetical protein K2L88_05730 [Clostridiales bacterium]|nr:hypothetical protein [Clostridiales bacterium]
MAKREKQLIEIEKSDIGILQFCLKVLYERENDELAWRLVERFGGASGIFGASHEELMQIDGMTDRVATFFTVMRPLQRQVQLRAVKDFKVLSERDLAEYAAVYFMNEYNPADVCVCLDKRNKIICAEKLGKEERVREIAALACKRNAQRLALIRFEPRLERKTVLPAPETQKELIRIVKLIGTLDIEFVDYVEYAENRFFSLKRAVGGDIGVYHVTGAKDERYKPWKNVMDDIERYYSLCVAHAIRQRLKY